MPRRSNAVALGDRLVAWLERTRRAEVDELAAGIIARTARLGDHLVIHESLGHGEGLLLVANAASGALCFVSERSPSGASTPIAKPEVVAAIARDLNAVDVGQAVH